MSYVTLSIDYDRDLIAICTMITIGLALCTVAACVDLHDEMRIKAHLRRDE